MAAWTTIGRKPLDWAESFNESLALDTSALQAARLSTQGSATDISGSIPVAGIQFDGVSLEYADEGPSTVVVTSASGQIVNNALSNNGVAFDGEPAAANGQFDIVINYTGDPAYASYFQAAAARWSQIITADIPDSVFSDGRAVDDILIDAEVGFIDGAGSNGRNILGQAGPDYVRLPSYLPIHGIMRFDSYDLSFMVSQGILDEVIMHEMGHVLGIGTIWSARGLLIGDASYYGFLGANALAEYRAMSGNLSATSVPVQPGNVGGSSGSHWSESLFQNELMTPATGPGTVMPLSRLTIASLADLGYTVNLNAADPYAFPGGTGAGLVSINDVSISEGNSGTQVATFTVTRTGGSAAFAVNYATGDGTALAGSDYVSKMGTLTFGAGVNSQTISVIINGDVTAEATENFFINLYGATNGAAIADSQGVGTIFNDDIGPGSISISDVTIVEGNNGIQLATFTVTRAGGTTAFSVNYATANNTAVGGSDYAAMSGTLNFAAGVDSQTITVVVNSDVLIENNESFFVNLSGATNNTVITDSQGVGTILNDDNGPGSVSIDDVTITEGDSGARIATFTVTRTGGESAFSANFATADASANAGSDYVATSGTLNFGDGENSKAISVTINGDPNLESNEAFFVNLSGATAGATITDGQGRGTIVNDDVSNPLPDDYADSFADLTAPFGQVSFGGTATGNLENAGDRDWFRLTVGPSQITTVELQGVDSGQGTLVDPYLYVYNGAGALLYELDNLARGLDALAVFISPDSASNTYYLAAAAFHDGYAGTYRLNVISGLPDLDDMPDSFADKSRNFGGAVVGGLSSGILETAGDRDWFAVNLTAGVNYNLELTGVSDLGTLPDPYLRLYDPAGALITENNDIDPGVNPDSLLVFRPTVTGTYYLEASGRNDDIGGIAGGTYYLRATVAPSTGSPVPIHDFNGDGKSDILWRNDAGTLQIWGMDGGNILSANSLGTVPSAWKVAGTGDFNGDGKSDILWRNDSTGIAQIWNMDDGNILSAQSLGVIPAVWKIVDTGDFNGDGKSDVLWQNESSGVAQIWDMDNGNILSAQSLGVIPAVWKFAGSGDFNGDHKTDLLWRNDSSGVVQLWDMDDGNILSAQSLGVIPAAWKIGGIGDFNGDSKSDLLWRNDSGAAQIWNMDNGNIQGTRSLGTIPSSWQIADVVDFTGNGTADILWRNDSSGAAQIWEMDNGTILNANSLGVVPDNWHILT
ncbi:VCBS repeat-containing protein [Bradyrhizobium lablabi]|uniref:Calx-beta domain-containing protein n=1 Tax=Bradyrhizobium lablabi TaxID=722472 RepID=UPI001BA712D0|nr:Calx-beta domain-containing protein [Bradyrhizobium lablabi]MBR1122683.1 VCBS repeat-containing protein [Bradyrhizobium lablabi]